MCDFFDDDFDELDLAFIFGYVETQMEGEREEKQENDPISFEESVSEKDEMLDED